jgi:hypothetical protein
MSSLREKDRNAVLMRYFENKTLAEVGTALGVNEVAAGKRITRAIGKLRGLFAKRGIVVPVVAVAALLSANAVQAAPAGLIAPLSTAAISGSTLTLLNSTLKLMTWIKIKTGIVVGASALLAAGTTILAVEKIQSLKTNEPNMLLAQADVAKPADDAPAAPGDPSAPAEDVPADPKLLIARLSHFAEKITSFEFTDYIGKVPDDYSKIVWQEAGDAYHLDEVRISKTNPDANWHELFSYDGERGYNFMPSQMRLYIQHGPYDRKDAEYDPYIRGPLMPFEFLLTQARRREKINMLQSASYLSSVADRASFAPDKDKNFHGHPCIAVKITDGYNRWENSNADCIAYFAKDLGLYPVGWEMYNKDEKLHLSFWIKTMKSVPISNSGGLTFLYPSESIFRNEQLNLEEDHIYPNVEINTLTKKDFILDPSLGTSIEDQDTKELTILPK